MHICGRQDKDSIGRWFFQGLEQGIKRFGGKHMRLVKHIDLVLTCGGRHHDLFAQVANTVDPTIGGGINLDDVERVASGNLTALLTLVAWFPIYRIATVDRLGKKACGTGFASAPGASKKIGMRQAATAERVFERANNRFLTN